MDNWDRQAKQWQQINNVEEQQYLIVDGEKNNNYNKQETSKQETSKNSW
jgi:hypothetical protein